MENRLFNAREVIFKEGDSADSMYKIVSGKVKIMKGFGGDSEAELATLKSGAFFGEMGLIEKAPRSASAVADGKVELLAIDADGFTKFVEQNATDAFDMMKNLSASLRKTTDRYIEATKTVEKYIATEEAPKSSVFGKLKKLVEGFKSSSGVVGSATENPNKRDYADGEVIFKKGETADIMYKVMDGEVTFFANYGTEKQAELAKAGKGTIFGEMGVIDNSPRNTTAVASGEVKLLPIASTAFLGYIVNNSSDALKILQNISAKLRKTTDDYVETLKNISLLVANDEEIKDKNLWAKISEYSAEYDEYVKQNPGDYYLMHSSFSNMNGGFFF